MRHLPRAVTPAQIFLAGTRDLDPEEADFIVRNRISMHSVLNWNTVGSLCEAIAAAGFRRVDIHFDVDVLNPDAFPDALMHAPGGSSFEDLSSCLRMLTKNVEIVGSSVVELRGGRSRRANVSVTFSAARLCSSPPNLKMPENLQPYATLKVAYEILGFVLRV